MYKTFIILCDIHTNQPPASLCLDEGSQSDYLERWSITRLSLLPSTLTYFASFHGPRDEKYNKKETFHSSPSSESSFLSKSLIYIYVYRGGVDSPTSSSVLTQPFCCHAIVGPFYPEEPLSSKTHRLGCHYICLFRYGCICTLLAVAYIYF